MRADDLDRIRAALRAAAEAVRAYTPGDIAWERKELRGDPVTEADHAANAVLQEMLPEPGEGWLSEESVDDPSRLDRERVWVVDPIDGTREFIEGLPEWCISVGLVEHGEPVAGGILNPTRNELVLGGLGLGVTYQGRPAHVRDPRGETTAPGSVARPVVLASRTEMRRGEWRRFEEAYEIRPSGSVAYKLALVAAGRADATWTLQGKSEWDVAGGAALVRAAGGAVRLADGSVPAFNKPNPSLPNFVAAGPVTMSHLLNELAERAE